METLKAVQPSAEVIIERNQESAAVGVNVVDEPKAMTALCIVDHDMTAVLSDDVPRHWQEPVKIDRMCFRETVRRRSNDDNGR